MLNEVLLQSVAQPLESLLHLWGIMCEIHWSHFDGFGLLCRTDDSLIVHLNLRHRLPGCWLAIWGAFVEDSCRQLRISLI